MGSVGSVGSIIVTATGIMVARVILVSVALRFPRIPATRRRPPQ